MKRHSPELDQKNFFPMFPPIEDDSIKYYKQTIPITLHHFYITNAIEEVDPFLDLINILKTAEQHDTIFINLNTPGGSLTTTIQIISAMRQSQATVVTTLEGEVASAGTLIFLAGHKHIVNQNSTFMIHNYSMGTWGKGNEISAHVKYSEDYFKKLAVDIYGNFLTATEIAEMLKGQDIWMDSDEVLSRLGVNKKLQAPSADVLVENVREEILGDKGVSKPKAKAKPKKAPAKKAPAKKPKK